MSERKKQKNKRVFDRFQIGWHNGEKNRTDKRMNEDNIRGYKERTV